MNEALAQLDEAGVLHQVSEGRRNRVWEAPEVVKLFAPIERSSRPLPN